MSGTWFGGVPMAAVSAAIRGRVGSVVAPSIVAEYRRVEANMLGRRGPPPFPDSIAQVIAGSRVVPDRLGPPVTADPDDDKFMWTALAADAALISGDRHLLDANGWRGVVVLSPRALLAELDAERR